MALVGAGVRARITFVNDAGSAGPKGNQSIDMLYVDSSHERQATIDELAAWRPVLGSDALVVLDDFTHPEYPGVAEAVRELGLTGQERGTLYVHSPSP